MLSCCSSCPRIPVGCSAHVPVAKSPTFSAASEACATRPCRKLSPCSCKKCGPMYGIAALLCGLLRCLVNEAAEADIVLANMLHNLPVRPQLEVQLGLPRLGIRFRVVDG